MKLRLTGRLTPDNAGCLLDALAFCPRLTALSLVADECARDQSEAGPWPSPGVSGFAQLRSLTKLVLVFGIEGFYHALAHAVDALVSLRGLAELTVHFFGDPALVPASLGQLKTLRSLELGFLEPCVFEAGCFDLPNLLSLTFQRCHIVDAEGVPGVSALASLTRIEFLQCQGPRFFDPQLVQLVHLQHAVFETGGTRGDFRYDETDGLRGSGLCVWLTRPPADMGSLTSSLKHISFCGHRLPRFPLALTQLVALEHLDANWNGFAEVPAAITALSRLTELVLGRYEPLLETPQPYEQCIVDVRALGDLSGLPALCRLELSFCEVIFCESVVGAVWHATLTRLVFGVTYPAPKCAPRVLQLLQAFKQQGRGGVFQYDCSDIDEIPGHATLLEDLSAFKKFAVAMQACGV